MTRSGFAAWKAFGLVGSVSNIQTWLRLTAALRWAYQDTTHRGFEEKPILTNLSLSSILRSGDASPGALILSEKPVRSQPERISWQLKMLVKTNRIAGSPWQRLILERLEPCEGKLSRTVLRGA